MNATTSRLLGMMLCLLVLSSCTADHHSKGPLVAGRTVEGIPAGAGVGGVASVGQKVSIGAFDLCTKAGPVTIIALRFTAAEARIVDATVLRRGPKTEGTPMGAARLPAGGTQGVGAMIDTPCRADGNPNSQELGVLLERLDPQPIDGRVVIEYTTDGNRPYSLEYPLRITFAAA